MVPHITWLRGIDADVKSIITGIHAADDRIVHVATSRGHGNTAVGTRNDASEEE